jgi:hypothetical protein
MTLGDYVIAIYENKWYVGKIVDTDLEGENGFMYNVSFREKRKKMFQWPRNKDIIWYKNTAQDEYSDPNSVWQV